MPRWGGPAGLQGRVALAVFAFRSISRWMIRPGIGRGAPANHRQGGVSPPTGLDGSPRAKGRRNRFFSRGFEGGGGQVGRATRLHSGGKGLIRRYGHRGTSQTEGGPTRSEGGAAPQDHPKGGGPAPFKGISAFRWHAWDFLSLGLRASFKGSGARPVRGFCSWGARGKGMFRSNSEQPWIGTRKGGGNRATFGFLLRQKLGGPIAQGVGAGRGDAGARTWASGGPPASFAVSYTGGGGGREDRPGCGIQPRRGQGGRPEANGGRPRISRRPPGQRSLPRRAFPPPSGPLFSWGGLLLTAKNGQGAGWSRRSMPGGGAAPGPGFSPPGRPLRARGTIGT